MLAAALAVMLAGCASGSSGTGGRAAAGGGSTGTARTAHYAGTADYLPGRAADLYLPSMGGAGGSPSGQAGSGAAATAGHSVPVVVLVPGGAWVTADRSGLAGLAEALAAGGAAVVNVTYRAASDGVRFPAPVNDVVCAVDAAADRVRRAGAKPGPVVVVGHSAGGHLAALAALAGNRFRQGCPYPAATVTGLVGLAGAYDVGRLSDVAQPLFGTSPSTDPNSWRDGNPLTYLTGRRADRPLRVLLVTGGQDTEMPAVIADEFAEALTAAGHDVRLENLPQASHATIYTAPVASGLLQAWLAGLPAD